MTMTVPRFRSIRPGSLDSTALRDALERHRVGLAERIERGEDGVALGRANARFLNGCFQLLVEGARRDTGLPNGVAPAAVGSFGRGAVAMRSDVDVVLIVDTDVVGAKDAEACAGPPLSLMGRRVRRGPPSAERRGRRLACGKTS